jgi:hypothetical protein
VISPDVQIFSNTGSGYNAASGSILIADFRPNSAAVRTSASDELARGTWLKIVERNTSQRYALLGFTDSTGPEAGNTKLRADRAQSVARLLPGAARRGVVGAAPSGDFIAPGNATPQERALNRSVLIRLPPEELREESQVTRYAGDAVAFWRANPTRTVADLLDVVSTKAGDQLERNGVPRPDVGPGTTVTGTGTLAYFNAADWKITLDATALAKASPQAGVTPATQLSTLNLAAVADLAQSCYHEARHAEQAFLAARLSAEEAKGAVSARTLSLRLGLREDVAAEALTWAGNPMPDVLKTKADAWRAFGQGGRHLPYRLWNDGLRTAIGILNVVLSPTLDDYAGKSAVEIRALWVHLLHPKIDQMLRRDYSFRADALQRDLAASAHQEAIDLDVRKTLEATAGKLFIMLARERSGARIPDAAALAKMSPDESGMAKLDAQVWIIQLKLALLDVKDAADTAYRAYPHEQDAYQVGEKVTTSVTEQGST